jgi:hypothetical protein
MKLTASQIDHLFTFTRQHYVEWYDLQSELVDHLANAIETQWQENPKLSFNEALNKEFKKFGVFGFMNVVEKRQAVLSKKYNSIVWHHFKDFFGIPKIVLTITITLLLFSVLRIGIYSEWIFISFYSILLGLAFYKLVKDSLLKKKKKQAGKKRWLFEEIIHQYGSFAVIIFFPFHIFVRILNHADDFFGNDYYILGLSFFLVLYSLVLFTIFKVIPSRAEEYLLATYPEYKFEKP